MDRAQRREIEWDCIALNHAFTYHIDHREYEALANLFAPNGVWLRHGTRLEGREQILAAMRARPAEQFTRHATAGFHFLSVEPTMARSFACNVSYFSFDAATLPARYVGDNAMVLDFKDVYIKTEEGWRFLERDTATVLMPDTIRRMMGEHAR